MRGRLLSVLLALGAAAPAAAATRDFALSGFDRIELGGVAELTVRTGAPFAVHAEGDDAAVAALVVEKRGGALVVGMRPGTRLQRERVRVAVSLPRLSGVAVGGAGSIAVDRVQAPRFDATLGGVGSLQLPAVAVADLRLAVSGTGSARVAGRADRIDLSLSGTGTIDAARLLARGGRIDASGVGSVHAAVDGPVDVSASGIGSVTVAGRPVCTIHRSGIGSVHCG